MKPLTLIIVLLYLSVVSAAGGGWFVQQFYNTSDTQCSREYIRTTAFRLDTCIIRGDTSTKYSANTNGNTDFWICTDNHCGTCVQHELVTNSCISTASGLTQSQYNTQRFPSHLLPLYYALSVAYTWQSRECLGIAEVLYITPGTQCVEYCDGDVQQFCDEFPAEIIEGVALPTSTPSPGQPTVTGPWVVAEYYTSSDCSEFAFAHLFELDVCMSPPNSDISSVYRMATDGNVHEYQCRDTVCGYCRDFGVPPGYKGCAREDAHDLPIRSVRDIPSLINSQSTRAEDPTNVTFYYLNTYVSTIFPVSIETDSTVVVYYQGYVASGHVCGGSVDHIIVTPHFSDCQEMCVYGLHFYCEVPQFLNASGIPTTLAPTSTPISPTSTPTNPTTPPTTVSPTRAPTPSPTQAPSHDSGKKSSAVSQGTTVAIVFVVIIVAAIGVGAFLYVKRRDQVKELFGRISSKGKSRYSLLTTNKEANGEDGLD